MIKIIKKDIWQQNFVSIFASNFLLIFGLLIFALLVSGCRAREVKISGKTMGTTYNVTVVVDRFRSVAPLKKKIEKRLFEINRSMSSYDMNSELSRFNKMKKAGKPFSISFDFFKVLKQSKEVYSLTSGAWDGTIKPVLNLWGFGGRSAANRLPDKEEIEDALKISGFDNIVIGNLSITKIIPEITIDLSSIAKGFGVDAVAEVIRKEGIENFLVEIGGEVFAQGQRLSRTDEQSGKWRIGINLPMPGSSQNQVYKAVELSGNAIATSGDYRNYFEEKGKKYSHIIDPRTGYPVDNQIVSVSVLAKNCTLADGLATGMMVMGKDKAMALAKSMDDVECLVIFKGPLGLEDCSTDGFVMQ